MKHTRFLCAVLSLFCYLGHAQPLPPVTNDNWGLKIVVFDVGQADAALLLTPNGDAALVDLGRKNDHGTMIAEYLLDESQNGVGIIDEVRYLFITHYDQDHIGGARRLMESDVVILEAYDQGPSEKRFVLSGFRQPRSAYKKYTALVGDKDGDGQPDSDEPNFVRNTAEPGLSFSLGTNDEVSIQILAVNGDTVGDAHDIDGLDPSKDDIDENPGSLIMLVSLGEFEYLTTGDATSNDWKPKPDTEQSIIDADAIPGGHDIDVLKVAHHGSDTSTGQDFISSTDPEIAIITSDLRRDRLPKLTTIKVLEQNGAQLFVTGKATTNNCEYHQSGNTFDDGYKPIRTIDQCGTITILIAEDGSKYSVYLENAADHVFTLSSEDSG